MSDSSDNNRVSKVTGYFCFTIFILSIIVMLNANITMFASSKCDLTMEYKYIEYSFWISIIILSTLVLSAILGLFFHKNEVVLYITGILTLIIVLGGLIIQCVLMGELWDNYPEEYIMFFNKYWTNMRVNCADSNKKWVYVMMGVICKIYSAVFMMAFLTIGFAVRNMRNN